MSTAAETARAATEANKFPYRTTKSQTARAIDMKAYRERDAEIRAQFEKDLAEEFAHDLHEGAQGVIFNKAWEDGHASGYEEVAMHYEELTNIVRAAL